MEDTSLQASSDIKSLVARDYEPTRIQGQLLSRAFELVCQLRSLRSEATSAVDESHGAIPGSSASKDFEPGRAA